MMAYAPQNAALGNYNTPAATSISPMQDARSALSVASKELADRLNELERRLASVLRPTGPDTPGNQAAAPVPVQSEHRQFLAITTNEVQHYIGMVESILGRLEL